MTSAKCVARAAVVAAMMLVAAGAVQAAITIDTVPVGDPGNAADTRYETPGYGAVAYTYNIGKYEVTAGQYTAFLTAVAGVDTYALYNTGMSSTSSGGITRSGGGTVGNPYTYSVAPAFTNRPVNYVSWGDVARFTNWLTNGQPTGSQNLTTTENGSYYLAGATTDAALLAVTRKADWKWAVTSEDEWYKAAYYKGGSTNAGYWDYPTGTNMIPNRVMSEATYPPGNNANYYADGATYPIDSGQYYTTVVGQFYLSDSPYGTFDQGGNVDEWNEAVNGSSRCLRGGRFNDYYLDMLAYQRGASYPPYEFRSIGFRVAEVPEPATMALLALGAAAVVARRRKKN
jgi:formylglycine-generating enzyme required for sulfatase activity